MLATHRATTMRLGKTLSGSARGDSSRCLEGLATPAHALVDKVDRKRASHPSKLDLAARQVDGQRLSADGQSSDPNQFPFDAFASEAFVPGHGSSHISIHPRCSGLSTQVLETWCFTTTGTGHCGRKSQKRKSATCQSTEIPSHQPRASAVQPLAVGGWTDPAPCPFDDPTSPLGDASIEHGWFSGASWSAQS